MDNPHANSFVVEHFSAFNLFATCITYLALAAVVGFLRAPRYPDSLPWVGHGKSWLGALKNSIQGFTKSHEWLQDGYRKYGKRGIPFIMPPMLGSPTEVSIPPSLMGWMLDQPDHKLSTSAAHYDILFGAYNFIKPVIAGDPYHERILHKNLARALGDILPGIAEEVADSIDDICGTDTVQFKSLDPLRELFMAAIPRVTNRMLVGKTLSTNKDFVDSMVAFSMDVVRGLVFLPLVPQTLQPIFGSLHSLWPKYHYWRSSRYTLPLVKQRLADIRKKDEGDPAYAGWEPPNDFITWSIYTARGDGRTDELTPDRIAMRVCPLNFGSIHTTALTAHNAILDILSADPAVVEALREEASTILAEENGKWTKNGLARMYKMDSAIRESQRFSVIGVNLITRKVVAQEGITTPDGLHFSYGCYLSTAWMPVSADSELHEKADEYDAFRYAREREQFEAKSTDQKARADLLKMKQKGMVTTAHSHQSFGHGRHACPGRFFVAHELKIMFAYLLMNYEIKHIEERPKAMWVGRTSVPPKAQIQLRRRKFP